MFRTESAETGRLFLADGIRWCREDRGMTMEALAEKAGVGRTTVHRLENTQATLRP